MADPNLEIIEELRLFLESVAAEPELRKLITNGSNDFSRNRKLPLSKVVSLLINMPKRSLSVEIEEFFEYLSAGQNCTKGAFSLQRVKLKPLFSRYGISGSQIISIVVMGIKSDAGRDSKYWL